MKITVSITRQFDTDDDHEGLFYGLSNPADFAIDLFAEDMDYLVKYNEVRDAVSVEIG